MGLHGIFLDHYLYADVLVLAQPPLAVLTGGSTIAKASAACSHWHMKVVPNAYPQNGLKVAPFV